jgi:hypothetical protein
MKVRRSYHGGDRRANGSSTRSPARDARLLRGQGIRPRERTQGDGKEDETVDGMAGRRTEDVGTGDTATVLREGGGRISMTTKNR